MAALSFVIGAATAWLVLTQEFDTEDEKSKAWIGFVIGALAGIGLITALGTRALRADAVAKPTAGASALAVVGSVAVGLGLMANGLLGGIWELLMYGFASGFMLGLACLMAILARRVHHGPSVCATGRGRS